MDVGAVVKPIANAADDAARVNPFGLTTLVLDDVGVAAGRVDELTSRLESMIAQYGTGTLDDAQLAATKDARIGVHRLNIDAQARLQANFENGLDEAITSRLQNADATLEDLGWQLAKTPSPDGRFNGVNLPGALREARNAAAVLRELVPAP